MCILEDDSGGSGPSSVKVTVDVPKFYKDVKMPRRDIAMVRSLIQFEGKKVSLRTLPDDDRRLLKQGNEWKIPARSARRSNAEEDSFDI